MHLLYYRLRPDVRAVCHAHPPTATGFAAGAGTRRRGSPGGDRRTGQHSAGLVRNSGRIGALRRLGAISDEL